MGEGDSSPRLAVTTCRRPLVLAWLVCLARGHCCLAQKDGRRESRCRTVNSQMCPIQSFSRSEDLRPGLGVHIPPPRLCGQRGGLLTAPYVCIMSPSRSLHVLLHVKYCLTHCSTCISSPHSMVDSTRMAHLGRFNFVAFVNFAFLTVVDMLHTFGRVVCHDKLSLSCCSGKQPKPSSVT